MYPINFLEFDFEPRCSKFVDSEDGHDGVSRNDALDDRSGRVWIDDAACDFSFALFKITRRD